MRQLLTKWNGEASLNDQEVWQTHTTDTGYSTFRKAMLPVCACMHTDTDIYTQEDTLLFP